jgi:hypothetical protein
MKNMEITLEGCETFAAQKAVSFQNDKADTVHWERVVRGDHLEMRCSHVILATGIPREVHEPSCNEANLA